MKVIDVYSQYFHADCVYHDIPRKAALVTLTATSDNGDVRYEVHLTFFPFRDPTDFAITCDAFAAKEIYHAPGRRSKKREAKFMEDFRSHIDELAAGMGGTVYWDRPLRDARWA